MEGGGDVEDVGDAGAEKRGVDGSELAGEGEDGRQGEWSGDHGAGGEALGGFGEIGAGGLAAEEAELERVFYFELLPRCEDEEEGDFGYGGQCGGGFDIGQEERDQQAGSGVNGGAPTSPRPSAMTSAWVSWELTAGGAGRRRQ